MFNIKWKKIKNQLMSLAEEKTKTHDSTGKIIEDLSPKSDKPENPEIIFDVKDPSESLRKELITNDDLKSYKRLGYEWITDGLEKLLDRFGIDMQKNFAGKGQFSVVFNKNGIVYKFTKNKKDIEKMLFFHSIKEKVPEKYRKHIVEVFDFGYDEDSKYYYLSCEKLYPLSKAKKSLLTRGSNPTEFSLSTFFTKRIYMELLEILEEIQTDSDVKDALNQVIKSPTLNAKCFELLINGLSGAKIEQLALRINSLENELLRNPNNILLKKNVKEVKADAYNKISLHLIEIIYSYVTKFVKSESKYDSEDIRRGIYYFVNRDIVAESVSVLSGMINTMFNRFPIHEPEDIARQNDSSLFGGDVLEFLRYLKDNYNIHFYDMHSNNFMERSNGDLVLSDVGFFVFK